MICHIKRWSKLSLITLCSALVLTGCLGSSAGDGPAPYVHFGMNGGADSAGVHTISAGDTLWSISNRYDISMQDIIFVNQLRPPYVLEVTQRLTLPPPENYRVRAGDSLSTIARAFNVSLTELTRTNRIQTPYIIHEGDVLKLPSPRPEIISPDSKPSAIVTTRTSARTARITPAPTQVQNKAKSLSYASVPKRSSNKFAWPTNGRIISSYGAKKGGLRNDGINIAASRGAAVNAAENGVVVYADDQLKGYGNLILVKHESRWMTAYAHMDNMIVRKGDVVKRGQKIGVVGSTGSVDSPQLHFEVRRGTNAINPKLYLAGHDG